MWLQMLAVLILDLPIEDEVDLAFRVQASMGMDEQCPAAVVVGHLEIRERIFVRIVPVEKIDRGVKTFRDHAGRKRRRPFSRMGGMES